MSEHTHTWLCAEKKGIAGEIVTHRPLTEQEVRRVESDPHAASEICNGPIFCSECNAILASTGSSLSILKTITEVKARLVSPTRFTEN